MATGTVLAVAAIASAVISAGAAVAQGQASKAQSKFQAGILRQQADRERLEAAAREEDFRLRQSRTLAARRAAMGASGVDISTGSPLLVAEDFAGEAELQALRIRTGGDVIATRAEQQAQLAQFQGRSAQTGSLLRAGSLLIGGAGKAFGFANGVGTPTPTRTPDAVA